MTLQESINILSTRRSHEDAAWLILVRLYADWINGKGQSIGELLKDEV